MTTEGRPGGGAVAREPGSGPAAFCSGPGHIIRYGNPAFLAAFGPHCVGLPAREGLIDLPPEAFALLDAVLAAGRPLARWIRRQSGEWRLTAAPRLDPETGEPYGVAFLLRSRADVPIVADPGPRPRGAAT